MGRGRGTSEMEKRGERSHVMMKAEAGERRPQAGGHLEAPELEEAGRTLPQILGQEPALLTSRSWASRLRTVRDRLVGASRPSWGHV